MVTRRIRGTVLLPPDAPTTSARMVLTLRDVSYLDARAPVLADATLSGADIRPNGRLPFQLTAPEIDAGQQLSLECHIALSGGAPAAGDLMTTRAVPVPTAGDVDGLEVPVSRV